MLGKEDRQISFFDTGFVCAHLIDKKSFYAKMHDCADKIITDDDFADIYCLNNGRPSVPPARITKVLILETYENISDREALEMLRFNIKWKYALDVPIDYEGFDRSLLVYFRARLLINNKGKLVFKKTLEFARETGLLKKEVDQVIDSTPMLGAAAVKDTYELLRDGIRKILSLADKKKISKMSLSLKAYGKNDPKPKINWDNKKEREELLSILVSDVKEVLSHVDTNIDVSAGNCPDKKMAEPLIDEAKEEFGVKTISVTADGAYSSPDTQKNMSDREIELISKVPVAKNSGKLSKEEFSIDLENEKVVCPEGKVAEKCYKSKDAEGEISKTFVFSKETCNDYPKKSECTNAKNTGRTITVGPNEKYLQEMREIQKTEEFKEIYNQRRPPVERKIAELIFHGLRKARYIGKRKSRLQALFTAAAVNLKRIFKEQQEKKVILNIAEAIPALT